MYDTTYDTTLGWRFVNPKMEEMGHIDSLGMTAENLAEERYEVTSEEEQPEGLAREYDISRERQDLFALRSHEKAVVATDEKRFREEIVPVTVKTRKGEDVVEADEGPKRDTSLEKLSKLKPAFKEGGTVTAGNSSSLNDGAAAVMVVSAEYAEAHGLKPRAKIRSMATAGVPPRIMGVGPVPATRKALERAEVPFDKIGLIELNEAFAAQVIPIMDQCDIPLEKLNPHGGAIALGHPFGMTGARIMTTLLNGLETRDETFGLETMCVAGGQGQAIIVERLR
jgi:acetyl-CoA acyltransferase